MAGKLLQVVAELMQVEPRELTETSDFQTLAPWDSDVRALLSSRGLTDP